MTVAQVKKELKEVRYYYKMKHVFDRNSKEIYPRNIMWLIKKYVTAMEEITDTKMYIIFTELYVNDTTQTDLADAWGVTRDYIKQMNKELTDFFVNYFDKKGAKI